MKTGDTVRVSGAAGEVLGAVVDARPPAELADVPGFDTGQVREILEEFGVIEVALIAHAYGDQQVCFVALRTERGWCDLQRHALDIEQQQGGE